MMALVPTGRGPSTTSSFLHSKKLTDALISGEFSCTQGQRFESKFKFHKHIKTQWKVVSDFTGKKEHFPPCDRFCFLGKKFFFGFSEKFSKFFFNEIDCKKFSNCFCNEFSSKKFFNSLKLTIKNFRNFFQ